ncbi:Inositol 3-kinase [Linum perenne]
MVTSPNPPSGDVLIVGNYCHDVLIQDSAVKAESLGGAASFISNVFNGMSIPCTLVSKVGGDFQYSVNHAPIVSPNAKTTVFHAYFDSSGLPGSSNDRILKRICACDPIKAADLPNSRFAFGMAIGVGGELLPETLEKMIEICDLVFVDIQALIRDFDRVDGTVKLVKLRETGFYRLLPRIGVLKASSEEATFVDVEEVRKWCCVVVTSGKEGCGLYWRDGNTKVSPFLASQRDPTGAGDSYLGGLVAGLVEGLAVPDAALLGNFFGALTVEQIGLPRFSARVLQRVKEEVQKRKLQHREGRINELDFFKPVGHEQFQASLCGSRTVLQCSVQECHWHPPASYAAMEQDIQLLKCTGAGQPSLLVNNTLYEEVSTSDSASKDC